MTKSYNMNQDENLTFCVLHSYFDNNIMQMQSLASEYCLKEQILIPD